ncbi:hypothetical protein [Celeribacter sp.]|uniref:hypothetical protein n=1 Tax=Celeribacter sp. TaxID=1890673 RepID=UPI003A9084E1
MHSTYNKKAILAGSVATAMFFIAGAVSADPLPDYTVTLDGYIESGVSVDLNSVNELMVEGALGATNTDLVQTAVSQLANAAARVNAGEGLSIDQAFDSGTEDRGIDLNAANRATAWTTQLDALIGASQVAMSSFNTAGFDVVASEDADGLVFVDQTLLNSSAYVISSGDSFEFNMSASNVLDAATAYAGTAKIDSAVANPTFGELIDNPDYVEGGDLEAQIIDDREFLNGTQQAVVSLNTLSGTAGANTLIEFEGQVLDTESLINDDIAVLDDPEFTLSANNAAFAFAARPATSEFVDPMLANELNDPSIANLDQVAAIQLNTVSLGDADSTADFTMYKKYDSSFDDYSAAQFADFDNDADELTLRNVAVATTYPDIYDEFSVDGLDSPWMDERQTGVGNVKIDDVSQVAALTVNRISQAGTGALVLKSASVDAVSMDDISYTPADFEQYVGDLDFGDDEDQVLAPNVIAAITNEGDAELINGSQIAQFGFNAISTAGDLLSWSDTEPNFSGIDQEISEGVDIEIGDNNQSYGPDFALNTTLVVSDDEYAVVDGLTQAGILSFNTISAGGNADAVLDQDASYYLDVTDLNLLDAYGDEGLAVSGVTQTALMSANTLNVAESLYADDMEQYDYSENDGFNFNSAWLEADDEMLSVDGFDQIAQVNSNVVTAGSIDDHTDISQNNDTDYGFDGINEIDVDGSDADEINVADVLQAAIFNFNGVNVDGDIGVMGGEDVGVTQSADDLDYFIVDDGLNRLEAYVEYGDVALASVDQIAQFSVNTLSSGNVYGASIAQDVDDLGDDEAVFEANTLVAEADYRGDASVSDSSQVLVLNLNTVSAGIVSGTVVVQDAYDIEIDSDRYSMNYVLASADQDLGDLRNVGGNASINGLSQTLYSNVNSVSAQSLSGVSISQEIDSYFGSDLVNLATVDSDWGVASATGIAQTAINRANSIVMSNLTVE